MAGRRARLDAELLRRGLAASRAQAQRLIAEGRVTVDGAPAAKPAALVAGAQAVVVAPEPGEGWASRGAHKLLGALERFDVPVAGRHCLDAGASTGGFTDVLLRRDAARVVAVDVGYGQLVWRLRSDPRVVVLDRTNVRTLGAGDVPPPAPGLVVADLSFISLRLVLPALRAVADPGADHLLMVKPQFEVGRDRVGKQGVVRDPEAWADALRGVVAAAAVEGLALVEAVPSPLPGPSGNIEFFLWLRAAAPGEAQGAEPTDAEPILAAALGEGRALAG